MELTSTLYGEDATGTPLVILHGLFGSGRNWASIARTLAAERPVHCVDMRNHGGSPWADSMTYGEMAEDVAGYIRARCGGRAAVIGHSMGGKAAMVVALTEPALVERLLVLDIAPTPYARGAFGPYVAAMQAVPLDRIRRRAEADPALADAVPEPPLRAFLLQNLMSDAGRLLWRINLEAIGRSLLDLYDFPQMPPTVAYQGPTLFLRGGASYYVLEQHREEITRLFPAATVDTMEGAGHWAHAEQPDAFTARAREFLSA